MQRFRPAVLAVSIIAVTPAFGAGQDAAPAHAVADAAASAAVPDTVDLHIVVTDPAGRPLAGLQTSDVELRDHGIVQTIGAVTFVSRSGTETADSPGGGRIFGILLDEFHIDPANTARVRDALLRFIDGALRADDQVVILKPLDSLARLHPSSDRAEIRARIEAFEGRRGDYEPRTAAEESLMSRAPATAAVERAGVVLSALSALTGRLGGLGGGRKALIVVSEGFAETPPRVRARSATLQTIVESAARADVAIYALNPAPDVPAAASEEALSAPGRLLAALAEQTGGTSAAGSRIEAGLATAAAGLDGYYRISYTPVHPLDGRHALEVRVNRAGATVRARAAHWAVPPPAPVPADRPSLLGRSGRLPRRPQQVSSLIATWFGAAPGADDRTQVTFTWEARARARTTPAWLTLKAVGEDGDVLFEGRVDPLRAVGISGVPTLSAVFEAPPGVVRLDMAIHGATGDLVDTDSRDIHLPDLRRGGAVLSTPAIIRTHNARQFRTLAADPQAPPAVSRRFSRTERLLIRVHASDADGRPHSETTARLIGRGDETLRELATVPDRPAPGLVQFDLPLGGLAAGDYGVEIRAGERRELVLFEISN